MNEDMEVARLCAEALGKTWREENGQIEVREQKRDHHEWRRWDPLKIAAQTRELIEVVGISVCCDPTAGPSRTWEAYGPEQRSEFAGSWSGAVTRLVAVRQSQREEQGT